MIEMQEYSLNAVFKACEQSATTGYKIADKQAKRINKTLLDAKSKVQGTLLNFQNSPCYISDATQNLEQQLLDIQKSFDVLTNSTTQDICSLKKSLSKFSITLFGRTMAGKSTLMEILKEGNGESIGKGAQRTTRDVRKYEWNGLSITDVPGIGAFEGKEDEDIAFNAAKSADLILFLITDDAPQAPEAECFGKIVNLGKPIICVMNVKASVNAEKSPKMIERDIERRFDIDRLNDIKTQFLSYSKQLGQEWGYIPFVYTHLKSAFLSLHTEDIEKQAVLNKSSRIDFLKKQILEQVRDKGQFYRIKTFIDAVSNPTLNSMETLLAQSQINSSQGRTILSKRRALINWNQKFERDSQQQINSLIIRIKSELNSQIASFAEEHFDDSNADKAWNQVLNNQKVEAQCQMLLDGLNKQCDDKIREISREISRELEFTSKFSMDKSLKMNKIIDAKKAWEWTTTILGGGLTIGAGIAWLAGAAIAGPLGWIALGVSALGILGSFFFKSRQRKEQEARTRLEENLRKNITSICDNLKKTMENNRDILIQKKILSFVKELDKMNAVIFQLADTQKELAWKLNAHLQELNFQILKEALLLIDAEGLECHIKSSARIPGNSITIILDDGKRFPEKQKQDLQRLMNEKIDFVFYTDVKKILISRIIGKAIDRTSINIEDKIGVAHIQIQVSDPSLINRIRLAQQLSEMIIVK